MPPKAALPNVSQQDIDNWFAKHFMNRGFDVTFYNVAQEAKTELCTMLGLSNAPATAE